MKIWKRLVSLGVVVVVWQASSLVAMAAEHGDESAINPLMFDPDLAIFSAVVFVLLLLFLGKFAWRPLLEGLDRRERSIADMIDEARRGSEQAAEKLQQYEARLAAATAEAQQIVARARQDATAAGERMLAEARAAADRERQRALGDIELAKNQAVQEIAERSADLAFLLARKLIDRELSPADHAALIRETLEQFPSQN